MAQIEKQTAPVGAIGFARCEGYVVRVVKQEDDSWVDPANGIGLFNTIPVFDTEGEAAEGRARKAPRKKRVPKHTFIEASQPKESQELFE